ncbi:MAG: hypothetical protein CL840_13360 [Crocinitomicaceae bacterium]|nr:hypothetical protein [Crocinitomicaceae bacterium]|tara:strand:+ start:11079 stop:11891 length:813 start_codon:yes stop_codon:yes gene_type:complete
MTLSKRILLAFEEFVFRLITKTKGNLYCRLFNFFSRLHGHNASIIHDKGIYFVKEKNWRFIHRRQGLMAYHKGLKERAAILKKVYLVDTISFADGDVILDCGANNGDFRLCFGDNIQYYGIEPSPVVFSNLKHNVRNGEVLNKGLWFENSSLDFYLSDAYGDSSIIEPPTYTEKVSIETITLDALIEEIGKPIKLLKLEAEGAEPEILKGLKKHLRSVEYVSIDVGFERGLKQESTLVPCANYLLKHGFELVDFRTERLVVLYRNKQEKT